MKSRYPKLAMSELCGWFGYKRQSYYKRIKHEKQRNEFEQTILRIVVEIRSRQNKIGTKKLHRLVNERLDSGFIGRDALYNLLRANGLLIHKRKRYRPKMTNGNGESIYPDLRKGFIPTAVNQLWCSDITYIDLNTTERHCYLICITDEYSHLIVGYCIALNMRTEQLLIALYMALGSELPPIQAKFEQAVIFHSDRGGQYKSIEFRTAIAAHNMLSSMCAAGKSHENPVAERLNGILKNELLVQNSFDSFALAKQAITKAIKIYNEERPHLSCEMLTPSEAHLERDKPLKKLWKQRKPKKK